jgi:hypothetical protein
MGIGCVVVIYGVYGGVWWWNGCDGQGRLGVVQGRRVGDDVCKAGVVWLLIIGVIDYCSCWLSWFWVCVLLQGARIRSQRAEALG